MPRHAVEGNRRMSLRIPAEEKAILPRAAALRRTDLTDFVRQHSLSAAREAIQEAEREAAGRGEVAAEAEMNIKVWHEEPIGKRHDREAFDCGETVLRRRKVPIAHAMGYYLAPLPGLTVRISAVLAHRYARLRSVGAPGGGSQGPWQGGGARRTGETACPTTDG